MNYIDTSELKEFISEKKYLDNFSDINSKIKKVPFHASKYSSQYKYLGSGLDSGSEFDSWSESDSWKSLHGLSLSSFSCRDLASLTASSYCRDPHDSPP